MQHTTMQLYAVPYDLTWAHHICSDTIHFQLWRASLQVDRGVGEATPLLSGARSAPMLPEDIPPRYGDNNGDCMGATSPPMIPTPPLSYDYASPPTEPPPSPLAALTVDTQASARYGSQHTADPPPEYSTT
eukprot:m.25392 g.25392  ORF g.25392 m.25392 type:complete len:131 (-) comp4230_c0_seq1:173-565(-)